MLVNWAHLAWIMELPQLNCPTGFFLLWAEFPLPEHLPTAFSPWGLPGLHLLFKSMSWFWQSKGQENGNAAGHSFSDRRRSTLLLWRKRAGAGLAYLSSLPAARVPVGGAWICRRLLPGAGSSSGRCRRSHRTSIQSPPGMAEAARQAPLSQRDTARTGRIPPQR